MCKPGLYQTDKSRSSSPADTCTDCNTLFHQNPLSNFGDTTNTMLPLWAFTSLCAKNVQDSKALNSYSDWTQFFSSVMQNTHIKSICGNTKVKHSNLCTNFVDIQQQKTAVNATYLTTTLFGWRAILSTSSIDIWSILLYT